MSNLVAVNNNQFNLEKVQLIKNTVAVGATDTELALFIEQCKRTGLDPITRQIYFIKNPKDGKVQVQVSIDGFRLVAERSGLYEGQTPPMWCGEDGVWKDVWLTKTPPRACKVGVYKKGFRDALYAVALFDEYCQRNFKGELSFMWNKMPSLMIAKVAESLALRKAFPNDLSGLYTNDEMAQAEVPTNEQPRYKTVFVGKSVAQGDIPNGSPNGVYQPEPTYGAPVGDTPRFEDGVPEQPAPRANNPAHDSGEEYVVPFGKFKGQTLTSIDPEELQGYVDYVEAKAIEQSQTEGRPMRPEMAKFLEASKNHLNSAFMVK